MTEDGEHGHRRGPGFAPGYLDRCEANGVRAVTGFGNVYLFLERDFADERAAGLPRREMFAELGIGGARQLHEELGRVLARSAARGSSTWPHDMAQPD